MATILDVSRRAGISQSTVSHVVNGTRAVRPETRRRVEAAIAAVGYTPNSIARALAGAPTSSVGIAISAISNPYFSDIICAIESECARRGLMVLLSDTQDDPEQEMRVLHALHQRRVDGIILAPSPSAKQRALGYLTANRIPCVLVDRLPARTFDQVGVQNKAAMAELVLHLIGHGHRRIGLVPGQPGYSTALERIAGYHAALRTAGLAADPTLVAPGSASVASAAEATRQFLALPDPPTAIATGNNLATIGAMQAIRAAGLHVPADIALAGFDDFEWADCFEPRLTLVAQPCAEIGRRAAEMLVERIRAPEGPPHTVRLRPRVIIRNSCGCGGAGA